MHILITPDSYKQSLTAREAAEIMERAIHSVDRKIKVTKHPLADGGEGTVEAVILATNGKYIEAPVHDPLMRPINARYGYLPDSKTAVIEMAAASGMQLMKPHEMNPMRTSTYGTGELIRHALDLKVREIIVGIGGSATVDGGKGALQALGTRFLDKNGHELYSGGGELKKLDKIDLSTLDQRLGKVKIRIACDVFNPLTGPEGAARVYGPQKGATPEMVDQLEQNLNRYAEVIFRLTGRDIRNMKCAGAAGGLGGGLIGILGARAEPGFEVIRKITGLDARIQVADLILTGEGKMDDQDLYGKAPYELARRAKKMGKPVLAFPGMFETGKPEIWTDIFTGIFPILTRPVNLEEAMREAESNLYNSVREALRTYLSRK